MSLSSPFFLLFVLMVVLFACEKPAVSAPSAEIYDGTRESASNIVLTHSDSGRVVFRITSPQLEKFEFESKQIEEFPKGLLIEFFDDQKNVNSSVYANYARRIPVDGTMTLKDSVVYINTEKDQLESSSILWDELNQEISTTKFFKLIRSATQDTVYGIGMKAKLDFSRFEVTKFEGKRKYRQLSD